MKNAVDVRRPWEAVRDEPRLLASYARSAWQSRVVGPLTAGRRPGGVAIFHVGRCGSTVLTDQLGQHPRIHGDGETYVRVIEAAKGDGIAPDEAGIDPVAYVEERLPRSGRNWFMYDLKFDHVTRLGWGLGDYLAGIDDIGVRHWVVLRRRNVLAKLVSGLMAGERGAYHCTDADDVEAHRVHIDVDGVWMDGVLDSLVGHIDRVVARYTEFAWLCHERPVLELEYEDDILADPGVGYARTVDFLGLEPAPVDVRLQKLNPFALADVIVNVDDVAKALARTPHAWMLA